MKKIQEEQKMQALNQKMLNSKLSRKKFCKIENLAYSTFGYWVKKFEKESTVFKEIKIASKASSPFIASAPEFVIEFPTGAKLTFNHLVDPAWIKSIV